MPKFARVIAGAVAMAGLVLALPQETAAKDFYEGKNLSLIAGYPPGGGVDNEMRLIAQFFSKFIPGKPNIVAKNMPGAGGMLLGNYLYLKAMPDGLELGMPGRSGFLLANSIGHKGAQYDLRKFTYIGSAVSTNSILWLRKSTNIRTLDELKKSKKEIVLGGLNSRSQNVVVPRILNKYEGFPFRTVYGYPGFNAVLIALERGEVDGLFSHEGSIQGTRPDMIKSGVVVPIFQTFQIEPNLPVLSSFVKNPRERDLLRLLNAPSRIGLPTLGPPGMNAEATKILRTSFQKMAADKAFRETAEKRGMHVADPATGEELQAFIAENLVEVPEDVVKEYLSYTERKKSKKKKKKEE
jgi:tripartite-type tricarboxylate transporter receptor subunit TctC